MADDLDAPLGPLFADENPDSIQRSRSLGSRPLLLDRERAPGPSWEDAGRGLLSLLGVDTSEPVPGPDGLYDDPMKAVFGGRLGTDQRLTLEQYNARRSGMAVAGGFGGGGFVGAARGERFAGRMALADALAGGSAEGAAIRFGELSARKLAEANDRLARMGREPLASPELSVPAGVVGHLRDARMLRDGMTADEVADLVFSAVHNSRSRVYGQPRDGRVVMVNPGEEHARWGVVERGEDGGAVVTGFPMRTERLPNRLRRMLGGD